MAGPFHRTVSQPAEFAVLDRHFIQLATVQNRSALPSLFTCPVSAPEAILKSVAT
jgi:hypothetical protein